MATFKLQNNQLLYNNDPILSLENRLLFTRPEAIVELLNSKYLSNEERNQLAYAYKTKDYSIINHICNDKWQKFYQKHKAEIDSAIKTTDDIIPYVISELIKELALYALPLVYSETDKRILFEYIHKHFEKFPLVLNEIIAQLHYTYNRYSAVLEKLEQHLTETRYEQINTTFLDLFFSALFDKKYLFAEKIGFGAITSIINRSALINVNKKAKYNVLYSDSDFDYTIKNTNTIEHVLAQLDLIKRIKQIVKDEPVDLEYDKVLVTNFYFKTIVIPVFTIHYDFPNILSHFLTSTKLNIAIAKHVYRIFDITDFMQILYQLELPQVVITETKTDIPHLCVVQLVDNTSCKIRYQGKEENYTLKKLQKWFVPLKKLYAMYSTNPVILNYLLINFALTNFFITKLDYLVVANKALEKIFTRLSNKESILLTV